MLGNSEHFYFKKKHIIMLKKSKTISKFPIYLSMSNDTLNFEIMVHKLYHFKLRILTKQNL